MAKLFDANGNEVEAFTADEMKVKNQEAIDTYLKENPSKDEALKKAEADLAAATAKLTELENGGGSQQQKERLLQQKKEAEAEVDKVRTDLSKEINDLKNTITSGFKNKVLSKLAGDDTELKKKIELEYDGFKGDASSEQEIQTRMEKAFALATGNKPQPNFMDGMGNGGQRGDAQNGGQKTTTVETPNGKAMRNAFGITDQDAEKFSPKPTTTNN